MAPRCLVCVGPAFTVGVTGHRPNRLVISDKALERRCRDLLAAFDLGLGDRPRVAVSALAEGADRAFARAALRCEYALHAVLPFAVADYEGTFSDPGTIPAYHHLLARAAEVRPLPGSRKASKDAYAAVGRAIVTASDIVVAVWDGEDAAGRGGTPDVIEMALADRKPVVWIDAAGRTPRRLLAPPPAGQKRPLAEIKQDARRLTRDDCARLAAAVG